MAIAINPRDLIRYVLVADRDLPLEQQTTFLLRPLTNVQRKLVEDGSLVMDKGGSVLPRVGSVKLDILRAGLAGWENLRDAEGSEVECKTEPAKVNVLGSNISPVTIACINRLHPADLEELVDAIQSTSRPSVDEGKG